MISYVLLCIRTFVNPSVLIMVRSGDSNKITEKVLGVRILF